MRIKERLKNTNLYRESLKWRILNGWRRRGFSSPSPFFVKHECLLRNGVSNATWVETGTYFGQTTEFLSSHASMVYSIEPEVKLYSDAKRRFALKPNVEIINGLSEDILPVLLPSLSGNVNFWLDGHYSAGVTFRGPQETPVLDELDCISQNMHRFDEFCVLIDDVRCFNPNLEEYSAYPALGDLVDWAATNGLFWGIEQDIFFASRRSL